MLKQVNTSFIQTIRQIQIMMAFCCAASASYFAHAPEAPHGDACSTASLSTLAPLTPQAPLDPETALKQLCSGNDAVFANFINNIHHNWLAAEPTVLTLSEQSHAITELFTALVRDHPVCLASLTESAHHDAISTQSFGAKVQSLFDLIDHEHLLINVSKHAPLTSLFDLLKLTRRYYSTDSALYRGTYVRYRGRFVVALCTLSEQDFIYPANTNQPQPTPWVRTLLRLLQKEVAHITVKYKKPPHEIASRDQVFVTHACSSLPYLTQAALSSAPHIKKTINYLVSYKDSQLTAKDNQVSARTKSQSSKSNGRKRYAPGVKKPKHKGYCNQTGKQVLPGKGHHARRA